MKKGISAIIATLLLVVITIGLAGMAAYYFMGLVPSKMIEIVHAGCQTDTAYLITVKNLDTRLSITVPDEISVRVDGTPRPCTWRTVDDTADITKIEPQRSGLCKIPDATTTTAGSYHSATVVGPSNSVEAPMPC
jgi:flagellin-like protein